MLDDSIISVVQIIGFPAVAYLLMYRLVEKTIEKNTQAIRDLERSIEILRNYLDRCDKK